MKPADDNETEIQRRIADARERRGKTYMGHSQIDLGDMVGGRYGILPKPSVTGTEPVPKMPEQPEGSPWAKDEFSWFPWRTPFVNIDYLVAHFILAITDCGSLLIADGVHCGPLRR